MPLVVIVMLSFHVLTRLPLQAAPAGTLKYIARIMKVHPIDAIEPVGNAFAHVPENHFQVREVVEHAADDHAHRMQQRLRLEAPNGGPEIDVGLQHVRPRFRHIARMDI